MASIHQNTAEGGSNGVTVTTGNSGGGSGIAFDFVVGPPASGTLEFTDVSRMHGNLAYRVASRGTAGSAYLAHETNGAPNLYGRFYFMSDVTPGGTNRLLQWREHEAGAVVGYLFLNASRQLSIRDQAAVAQYTFTNTLTNGVWYRIEYNVIIVAPPSVNATIQCLLYIGDSLSPLEDSGVKAVTLGASIADWSSIRYGNPTSVANIPSATGFWYYDDLYAFASGFPGPAIATEPGPPPLISAGSGVY